MDEHRDNGGGDAVRDEAREFSSIENAYKNGEGVKVMAASAAIINLLNHVGLSERGDANIVRGMLVRLCARSKEGSPEREAMARRLRALVDVVVLDDMVYVDSVQKKGAVLVERPTAPGSETVN